VRWRIAKRAQPESCSCCRQSTGRGPAGRGQTADGAPYARVRGPAYAEDQVEAADEALDRRCIAAGAPMTGYDVRHAKTQHRMLKRRLSTMLRLLTGVMQLGLNSASVAEPVVLRSTGKPIHTEANHCASQPGSGSYVGLLLFGHSRCLRSCCGERCIQDRAVSLKKTQTPTKLTI
jgi:hypothetical protein